MLWMKQYENPYSHVQSKQQAYANVITCTQSKSPIQCHWWYAFQQSDQKNAQGSCQTGPLFERAYFSVLLDLWAIKAVRSCFFYRNSQCRRGSRPITKASIIVSSSRQGQDTMIQMTEKISLDFGINDRIMLSSGGEKWHLHTVPANYQFQQSPGNYCIHQTLITLANVYHHTSSSILPG